MIKLKTVLLFFVLIFGLQQLQAQSYKFMTTGFSVMEKNEKGKWGKWSELQDASIMINLDTSKNRLIIYSQEIQLYDILNYEDVQDNENDLIYTFTCKNDDGLPFTISIITRKKQDNRKQLYINQENTIVVYNIVNYILKDEHKQ